MESAREEPTPTRTSRGLHKHPQIVSRAQLSNTALLAGRTQTALGEIVLQNTNIFSSQHGKQRRPMKTMEVNFRRTDPSEYSVLLHSITFYQLVSTSDVINVWLCK